MTPTTEVHAGTTGARAPTPFDDALDDLRVTGTVLLHESYAAPWAIAIPAEPELRALLGLPAGVRVVPFHLVRRGGFALAQDGLPPLRVDAEEVAICPGGAAHRIGAGSRVGIGAGCGAAGDAGGGAGADVPLRAHGLAAVLAGDGPPASARAGGETELVCGVFRLRAGPLNPLLAALPPVLRVSVAAAASPMLARVAEMLTLALDDGRDDGFTAARLVEVFCAEAIGAYRRRDGAVTPGWFRGLDDERVGRAIAAIHRAPAEAWTVARLAALVAMSPSRFAARFRATAGVSVMAYVATWRATVACRLLRETEAPLARVAADVGYEDAAAFSRAFKALVGENPTAWRTAHRRRSS